MPRKGNKRVKRKTHRRGGDETAEKLPRSFVFRRGSVSQPVSQLVMDMRKVMRPLTATRLKESKRNKIKDFVNLAGPLGVTHLCIFTQSSINTNLRVARLPRGPTCSFHVNKYSLMSDIVAFQKRPESYNESLKHAPLVLCNGFGNSERHRQLASAMFQSMFPSLNVQTVKLTECRRVVLFNYNEKDGTIDVRHYVVKASPVGLNRSIKRVIKKRVPDLGKYEDIASYVLEPTGYASSDSEAEDTPETRLELPQDFVGNGNRKSEKSAVRLKEIGPRLTLQLIKIVEKIDDGRVLYHAHQSKTKEEEYRLEQQKKQEEALRRKRKRDQKANVDAKEEQRLTKKRKVEAKKAVKKRAKEAKLAEQRNTAAAQYESDAADGSDSDSEDMAHAPLEAEGSDEDGQAGGTDAKSSDSEVT